MSEREELATTILAYFHPSPYAGESWRLDPTSAADAILAAGYRKPRTITEYSIVFNGHASGLIPPAVSIAEFQERYERETGWMLTDRDVYIQRTFQTVDPEFGDWELMPTTAPEPLP